MKRLLGVSLLAGLVANAPMAAEPLTGFQQFRSYPFLDRAYREAGRDNWAEVERLMRHLLERVPRNDEARSLLVEALAKQRRYREAEALATQLSDGHDALLELRLTWIEQDPPGTSLVEAWLAQSEGDDHVRLWQAYSLSLARFGGAKRALDWLNEIPPKGDDQVLRMARANWAERLRDWSATEQQLAALEAEGRLSEDDWRRLANARVQLLDEAGLQRLLARPPSPAAERQLRLAMLDRAVALGQLEMAKRWLASLPPADRDSAEQRGRLWELARQGGDTPLVRELGEQLGRPCLETAEWLSRHDPGAALEQLRDCRAEDDPQTWLVLAQRLQAEDLLQRQRLAEPWDSARRDSLLALWREQGRGDLALAWLARQPQTPAVQRQRAELLQAAGQREQAERLWFDYYRSSGDLQALDQASYLAVQAGRRDAARQWLEQAFDSRGGRLPAPLLQRLAGLYAEADAPLDMARARALLAHLDGDSRAALLGRLAESGHCAWVRGEIADTTRNPAELRVLGRCAMPARPGEAVVYYQAALAQGDQASRLPLAYALEAAGDAPAAWRIWRELAPAQLDNIGRLTAARSALGAGEAQAAERYWQAAQSTSADDWALGAAIAQAGGDLPLALQRQRLALDQRPQAGHYYGAAATAQLAGDTQQSTAWLAEAARLEPANPRYNADYAMRLAAAESAEERRRAIAPLQRATRDYPEDYRLGETLAWRYAEAEDSVAARLELRRVIDLEQHPVAGDDQYGSLEARRYRQRRAHESLSRRDSFTLASVWSPAGVATNDILRDDGSRAGESRRAASSNVQMAVWDHALGAEPSRAGRSLSVYGRALLGGDGRHRYGRSLGTGLGLRYRPLGTHNLNLYSELYAQSELDDADFDGFSLGQWLNPAAVSEALNDHVRKGQVSTDLLLRATASFFDQGDWRNDWRVDETQWNERSLYLDAAWWTRAGDHAWLSRYQQGRTYKLAAAGAQTLMPYGFVEFSAQDPRSHWRQDWRSGLGLRWQLWYGDSRYNAYPANLKVNAEYQWGLGGNLYERASGVLLRVEVDF